MQQSSASIRVILLLSLVFSLFYAADESQGYTLAEAVIADHTCLNMTEISQGQIEAVKKNIKIYYGHTSHGSQVRVGLERIYAALGATYRVAAGWDLPSDPQALCIRDRSDTYDPGDFFPTVPQALRENPNINVVMYMWCGQPGNDWQSLLQAYLSQLTSLEQQYPKVIFIYATGHAQEPDCSGDNRQQFNEALRQYCKANKKALFDFGDIDVWYAGQQHTYSSPNWCAHAGQAIPLEHPQYHGDQAGHTTYESCENKGKAFWWLLAKINGWDHTVPVELVSLQAVQKDLAVHLSWSPASGIEAVGYEIERRVQKGLFSKRAYLPASAASTGVPAFSFFDDDIQIGETYYYRLRQIGHDGQIQYSDTIKIKISSYPQFDLWHNYPNPFNRSTEIGFYLPQEENVCLEIYAMNGQKIRTLTDERRPPGVHKIIWDGLDEDKEEVASGLYLYRLKSGTFSASHKMAFIK